eukprot:2316241-Rhodomonas_salina.4
MDCCAARIREQTQGRDRQLRHVPESCMQRSPELSDRACDGQVRDVDQQRVTDLCTSLCRESRLHFRGRSPADVHNKVDCRVDSSPSGEHFDRQLPNGKARG